MSAFNTLIAEVVCGCHGGTVEMRIQFKYGDTWDYLYRLGDQVRWGGNDIGSPTLGLVRVYGAPEVCPECGCDDQQFELSIIDGRIVAVDALADATPYVKAHKTFRTDST